MSDLVRYAVGNTIRRDHSQWPTILESEVQTVVGSMTQDQIDELWPKYISLAQIMAMSWRVRKWNVTGSSAVTISRDDGTVRTVAGTSTLVPADLFNLVTGGGVAATEADLLEHQFNGTYRALVGNGISSASGDSPVANWTTTSTFYGDFGGTTDPGVLGLGSLGFYLLFDVGTETFAPTFSGIGDVIPSTFFTNQQLRLTITFFRTPVTVNSGIGAVFMKAPGTLTVVPGICPSFIVPLQLAWRLGQQNPGDIITGTGTGAYTMTATEFWPYANSENDPVYDTASGSQHVNPFS